MDCDPLVGQEISLMGHDQLVRKRKEGRKGRMENERKRRGKGKGKGKRGNGKCSFLTFFFFSYGVCEYVCVCEQVLSQHVKCSPYCALPQK